MTRTIILYTVGLVLAGSQLIMVRFLNAQEMQDTVYVFSERLGVEIDRSERDYFGLFPNAAGYVTASASVTSDSNVAFRVHCQRDGGAAADTVFVIDPKTAAELRVYVEEFERAARGRRAIDLPHIAAVASKPKRVLNTPQVLKVFFRSSAVDSGIVLCVTDTSLVLWAVKHGVEYAWSEARERVRVIHLLEVRKIVIEKKAGPFPLACAGGLLGALVGGVVGLAQGDDHSGSIIELTAWQNAYGCGFCLGLGGALVGGALGYGMGRDQQFSVSAKLRNLDAVMYRLRECAVFDTVIPPEVNRLLF